jgi:hypothetical protein
MVGAPFLINNGLWPLVPVLVDNAAVGVSEHFYVATKSPAPEFIAALPLDSHGLLSLQVSGARKVSVNSEAEALALFFEVMPCKLHTA